MPEMAFKYLEDKDGLHLRLWFGPEWSETTPTGAEARDDFQLICLCYVHNNFKLRHGEFVMTLSYDLEKVQNNDTKR